MFPPAYFVTRSLDKKKFMFRTTENIFYVLKQIVLLGFLENLDRLLGVRLHRPDIVLIITSATASHRGVRMMIMMIVIMTNVVRIAIVMMLVIVKVMYDHDRDIEDDVYKLMMMT